MITILNRKELMITYSLELQAKIRNLLSAHNIDYSISTTGNLWRNSAQGLGFNPATRTEYKIYVKRKDYEKAVFLLNKNR